jgi:hypothetical protein
LMARRSACWRKIADCERTSRGPNRSSDRRRSRSSNLLPNRMMNVALGRPVLRLVVSRTRPRNERRRSRRAPWTLPLAAGSLATLRWAQLMDHTAPSPADQSPHA